ncbi:MAG: aspartate kinase [Gemmatimonadota bacterium]
MLIVQKFGGTSVATPDRIRLVADRVVREKKRGNALVVVVSAMAHTTDELLELAGKVVDDPRRKHPREVDMLLTSGERIAMALLAMAIRERGVEAISLTGSQAAIITDETHTGARIQEIRATRVREELERDRVVIVAGFQGVSRTREVTTLGRGGSDTTAVALAAAIPADRCDIYTDVEGVYTSDPRRVKGARLIGEIDYQEMVELATSGAQVMHPRAVEIGARFGVPIRVLSSFHDDDSGGTLITRRDSTMEGLALTGLACEGGYARIAFRGLPPDMTAVTDILSRLAEAGVSVDMLAQVERDDGKRQVQLTVEEESFRNARGLCDELLEKHGGESLDVKTGLTRVAMVGSGMQGLPGVYARTYRALLDAGIEVYAVSSSAISISLLVESGDEDRSLQVLHAAFDLGDTN